MPIGCQCYIAVVINESVECGAVYALAHVFVWVSIVAITRKGGLVRVYMVVPG